MARIELEMGRVKCTLDESSETLNVRKAAIYAEVLRGSLQRYGRLPEEIHEKEGKEGWMIDCACELLDKLSDTRKC